MLQAPESQAKQNVLTKESAVSALIHGFGSDNGTKASRYHLNVASSIIFY